MIHLLLQQLRPVLLVIWSPHRSHPAVSSCPGAPRRTTVVALTSPTACRASTAKMACARRAPNACILSPPPPPCATVSCRLSTWSRTSTTPSRWRHTTECPATAFRGPPATSLPSCVTQVRPPHSYVLHHAFQQSNSWVTKRIYLHLKASCSFGLSASIIVFSEALWSCDIVFVCLKQHALWSWKQIYCQLINVYCRDFRYWLDSFLTFCIPWTPSDPPMVTSIRLDDYSPTSLSLSWTLDRRVHPQSTHRYELMYRKKVRSCYPVIDAVTDIIHACSVMNICVT